MSQREVLMGTIWQKVHQLFQKSPDVLDLPKKVSLLARRWNVSLFSCRFCRVPNILYNVVSPWVWGECLSAVSRCVTGCFSFFFHPLLICNEPWWPQDTRNKIREEASRLIASGRRCSRQHLFITSNDSKSQMLSCLLCICVGQVMTQCRVTV